ncbi:Phage head morphogenesis domain containing protein [uncultured Caudovirales phage]|uniref:Phage head morphogenesis domain containing protein n=1 Tax=uncultured Caudovirales phage TaxID=2100421 RepID=A0A6J5Q456_9CAUD|nr:Phage head morphogenesis domain containing protein [uncultured Caudovirales phage]CAB4210562.1 Phage head morphogenesis domain containing protein [uncultured Caudovirales phage]CAB4223495.1 Phage head morphogenesis domain containing protein [uncultured Caudovirales phage]
MFNRRGRERDVAEQLRLTAISERALALRMRAAINRASIQASESYTHRGSLDYALRGHYGEIERLLIASYTATINRMGKRVFDAVGKANRPLERKDAGNFFQQAAQDWISRYTAEKVTAISSTTRSNITNAISEGESLGIGIDATARLIREKSGGVIASTRALIIARTESHAAATFGGDAAVDALGIPDVKREWISVEDQRTRPTHSAANGQVVKMDEPFIIGGAGLIRPGDPSGPPEETISCRCVIGYIAPGYE